MQLDRLNSMTKYPSIPTYHTINGKTLLPEVVNPFDADEVVYILEKIDGTNSRIIIVPEYGIFIGTREEILWGQLGFDTRKWKNNDSVESQYFAKDTAGIVDNLMSQMEYVQTTFNDFKGTVVFYFETFGKGIGGSHKNYTKENERGCRLFDVRQIDNYKELLELPRQKIQQWREGAGYHSLTRHKQFLELESLFSMGMDTAPYLFSMKGSEFPITIEDAYEFLKQFKDSKCHFESGLGRSEGVIVRTKDRSKIKKLRFEEYEKTLGIR